jgi:hypothetical protein
MNQAILNFQLVFMQIPTRFMVGKYLLESSTCIHTLSLYRGWQRMKTGNCIATWYLIFFCNQKEDDFITGGLKEWFVKDAPASYEDAVAIALIKIRNERERVVEEESVENTRRGMVVGVVAVMIVALVSLNVRLLFF